MTVDKNDLLKMANNPDFIPGIYNYCDRWCERCAFTRRCSVYVMEKEAFPDQQSRDLNNKEFWRRIHESMKLTKDLLQEMVNKQGIDLNSIDTEEIERERRAGRERAKQTVEARSARHYSRTANEWFKIHENLFKIKDEILSNEHRLGIKEPEVTLVNILDAVDVIRWYQDQIWVKLMRALDGESLGEILDDEMANFPKDCDGSAKVALIGVDRSIGAWSQLRENLEDESGSILEILRQLDTLRTKVENRFPRARSFVRPGFDQEVAHVRPETNS